MRFCTAINCMDGRAQTSVIQYLQKRFHAEHVDMITEPGPNRILAEGQDAAAIASIQSRVLLSVERHQSVGIAVIGHHDCAGNQSSAVQQNQDTVVAVRRIRTTFPDIPVIGLWLNEGWKIEELEDDAAHDRIDHYK